jgi:hypothetical protein
MPLALRPDHGCPNSLFKLSTRSSRPMLCQAVEAAATCWGSVHETESIPLTEYCPIFRVPEYSELSVAI